MINFDDLPCDIKSKIYKINKDREREEHWELMMAQVKQKAIMRSQTKRASLYSTGRDPSDVTFMIREDRNLVHNDMEYRTHWDFRGNVEIWWNDPQGEQPYGDHWLDFLNYVW